MTIKNHVSLTLKDKNTMKPEGKFIMLGSHEDIESYRGSDVEKSAINVNLNSEDFIYLAKIKGRSVIETVADMLTEKYSAIESEIDKGNVVFMGANGSWFCLPKSDLDLYTIKKL